MPIAIAVAPREHPLPPVPEGKTRFYTFPWKSLNVGDWFYAPYKEGVYRDLTAMVGMVTQLARRRHAKEPARFAIMKVGSGVRVYRIK